MRLCFIGAEALPLTPLSEHLFQSTGGGGLAYDFITSGSPCERERPYPDFAPSTRRAEKRCEPANGPRPQYRILRADRPVGRTTRLRVN